MKLSNEYRLLIDCCPPFGLSKADDEISTLVKKDTLDWDFIIRESSYHEVLCLLYGKLKHTGLLPYIPAEKESILKANYFHTFARNTLLREEYIRVSDGFGARGIDCLSLKGVSLLAGGLYENTALRPMVDIDIIIKERDVMAAAEILERDFSYNRSTSEEDDDHCHIVFSKRDPHVIMELHIDSDYSFSTPKRIVIPGIWERMHGGGDAKTMSHEDMFFSLALHQRRLGKPFILKYICDIDRLVRNGMNWGFVEENARRFGLVSASFLLLKTAKRIFSTPVPQAFLDNLYIGPLKSSFSRHLINRFIFQEKGDRKSVNKYDYMYSYMLMHDRISSPLKYILSIDKKRFAKFYGLAQKGRRGDFLYVFRIYYMGIKFIIVLFNMIKLRLSGGKHG